MIITEGRKKLAEYIYLGGKDYGTFKFIRMDKEE
jgi:hypothetical protein